MGTDSVRPVLVTGSSGFVGRNLVTFFLHRGPVVGVDIRPGDAAAAGLAQEVLDVCDYQAVATCLRRHRPAVVIHAAGNKNVRYCQDHPREAHAINAQGTANVARACREAQARLVYLSTDLVFDSERGGYRETDEPATTLVYGQTKYLGERLAQDELEGVIVCRSGGIYGRHAPLLHWLADEVRQGRPVHCFTDIYNTPTYADNLSEMIQALLDHNLRGIFHTVGGRRVNRMEFFSAFCRCFGLSTAGLMPTLCADEKERLLLRPDSSLDIQETQRRLAAAGAQVVFDDPERGLARLREAGEY